jgi:2-C-methyl-D-erythritol 4-phosphate cytidylyltransferase
MEGDAVTGVRRPVVAVVLAGGAGLRFGGEGPKQLHRLRGRTLLEWAVLAFVDSDAVDEVVVVVPPSMAATVRSDLDRAGLADVALVDGGVLRSDSTRAALTALGDRDCDVLLHDAARPLVDERIIHDCVAALESAEAVTAAVASTDTVAEIDDAGRVQAIPERARLRNIQTPQGFRLATIRRAFALMDADDARAVDPSDDCSVVLRYLPEVRIGVVEGSARNLKVTHPQDLEVAEAVLTAEA